MSGCGNGGTTAGGTCSATCDSGHGYTGTVEGDYTVILPLLIMMALSLVVLLLPAQHIVRPAI